MIYIPLILTSCVLTSAALTIKLKVAIMLSDMVICTNVTTQTKFTTL